MTDLNDVLVENRVHMGDPELRVSLAAKLRGWGVTVAQVQLLFASLRADGARCPARFFVEFADKGMESMQDAILCAERWHQRYVRAEPGERERWENMSREQREWAEEDERMLEHYREKFGEGKLDQP